MSSKELKSKPNNSKKLIYINPLISFLCLLSMILATIFIYWCWICIEYNHGKLLLPISLNVSNFKRWLIEDILSTVISHATPSLYAIKVYLFWILFQAFIYKVLPGHVQPGKPLKDGFSLTYKLNGQLAFLITNILAFVLHYFSIFKISTLYDLFPELLTTAIITSFLIIFLINALSNLKTEGNRVTNSPFYNFFMGIVLNPGASSGFDIKYFFELRPGIMMWWFTTLGMAFKMYEDYHTVSTPMILICFFHICFINACYKGEQCVMHSFDIIYENLGWMLLMLDIVMVPFIFPLQGYYLYKLGIVEWSYFYTLSVTFMHIFGYYLFDTANSQKDYFKEGANQVKKGFPRLPWDTILKPEYIETKQGGKILISGWWKFARHMNYTGDIMMSWAWGLICGVNSYFPFVYTTYLTSLLIHREYRDNKRCMEKYGKDWEEYCKKVPYRLIPFVY